MAATSGGLRLAPPLDEIAAGPICVVTRRSNPHVRPCTLRFLTPSRLDLGLLAGLGSRLMSPNAPRPLNAAACRDDRPAHAPGRLADDPHAAALPVGYKGRVARGARLPGRAKVANVGVPLADEADRRQPRSRDAPCWRCRWRCSSRTALLRLSTTVFTELREFLFAKVTQRAVRTHRAQGLPPSARAVAALPPGAPDRRAHARRRARHSAASRR